MNRFPLLIALVLFVSPVLAAPATQPSILNGVGVEQRLGSRIPLDLRFADENGKAVQLRQLIHDRPVLLTLVYYQCPMLCTVTLNQLSRSLNALSESAGDQFDILTISFDPRETSGLAAAKKQIYLKGYQRPTAANGWHFLTGSEDSIRKLTSAVGFNYRWDAEHQIYAHASAVVVLTPDGTISRYFLGVDYPPVQLRQAIRDADAGSVGAKAEQVFLYCFHYDPATGRYGLIINRAIQALGLFTVVALAGLIMFHLHRERKRSPLKAVET
jgi:protein SCO1/2